MRAGRTPAPRSSRRESWTTAPALHAGRSARNRGPAGPPQPPFPGPFRHGRGPSGPGRLARRRPAQSATTAGRPAPIRARMFPGGPPLARALLRARARVPPGALTPHAPAPTTGARAHAHRRRTTSRRPRSVLSPRTRAVWSAPRPGRDQPGAEPVPPSGQARRLRQPRGRRRLPDLARLDVVVPARLGGQEPDVSAVCEWRQRVRQRVEEITVSIAPPEQDRVDHVVVVLADKFHVLALDDGLPQCLITVLCVADLLHHLTRLDAKSLGQVRLVLSLARGRAH